jgi:hypothetical protein
VINDAALAYMRERALAGPVIQQLAAHPQRRFADQSAWTRHLEQLGIADLQVAPEPADRFAWHRFASRPDPMRIATEGALWGAVTSHGFLCEAVVVSKPALGPAQPDPWDAGQFDVGQHALCWIHAERLVHKLDAFTDAQRTAQQHVRGLIPACAGTGSGGSMPT